MTPRRARPEDIKPTAQLWCDGWHETQAPHVPDRLIAQRTLSSFETRLLEMGDLLRVAGPAGAPIGMCAIRGRELHQLFVAPSGRGTGTAVALLSDAEQRMALAGETNAFLDCLIENEPAKRFYTRNGWVEGDVEIAKLDTLDGGFKLPCLIFRKTLTAHE
jgi:GNAT superfamily N-acetyltransferase